MTKRYHIWLSSLYAKRENALSRTPRKRQFKVRSRLSPDSVLAEIPDFCRGTEGTVNNVITFGQSFAITEILCACD